MPCKPCTACGLNSRHKKCPPLFNTYRGCICQHECACQAQPGAACYLDSIDNEEYPVCFLQGSVYVGDIPDAEGDRVAVLRGALYRQLLSIALCPAQQVPACQGVCQLGVQDSGSGGLSNDGT